MNWIYEGSPISSDRIPEGSVGFIYKILHFPTERFYIGKKSLTSNRKVKLGKRELQRIKEERKENGIRGSLPRSKTVIKESDWGKYYSSNDEIKSMVDQGLSHEFERFILKFCFTKKSLSYYETKFQFEYNVLEDPLSFNNNILGKFFRKDI